MTGQPCGPPDTPSLADLNCVGRLSCDRSTPQTYSVPLCVVVANLSPSAQLTFDVEIMGEEGVERVLNWGWQPGPGSLGLGPRGASRWRVTGGGDGCVRTWRALAVSVWVDGA